MAINIANLGSALSNALKPASTASNSATPGPVVSTASPASSAPAAKVQPATQASASVPGLKAGYVGIRDSLIKSGIDSSQIGYNSATGYVTVNGQPILKADQVINGVSYADPSSLQSGLGVYKSQQQASTDEKAYRDLLNGSQSNPYDQQVSDALTQYLQMIQNPTPYDVYSDPQYAAYQAQQQRAADKGIRAAQESMGASGFGRSTNLAERAQSIQNDANEYLQTQVIPALMTAHTAEEQAKLQNLASYLQVLSGQQQLVDTRTQDKLTNAGNLLTFSQGRADTAYDRNYQASRDQYQEGRDKVQDAQWAAEKEISEAALTGMYKGKKTTPEQQRVLQNAWTEAQQLGKVTPALAALDPTLKVGQLLESTRQFNEGQQLQRDQMAQSASIAAADRAAANARSAASIAASAKESQLDREFRAKQADLDRADKQAAEDKKASDSMKQEASAMLGALRDGSMTPAQASRQIDDDLKAGLYTQEEAKYLKGLLNTAAPTATKKDQPTADQANAAQSEKPRSDKELDAEAKKLGVPAIDYRDWYRSPSGRIAGVSYQEWKSLYGPRLSAK